MKRRELFADPITDRASAIIVAHNHPIGDLNPSKEDNPAEMKDLIVKWRWNEERTSA